MKHVYCPDCGEVGVTKKHLGDEDRQQKEILSEHVLRRPHKHNVEFRGLDTATRRHLCRSSIDTRSQAREIFERDFHVDGLGRINLQKLRTWLNETGA